MAQKVRIQYIHPMKSVRALTPKPLIRPVVNGEDEYCSPIIVPKGKDAEPDVFYDVSEAYARRLLGAQPERYHLISPARLSVNVRNGDGFSFTEKSFTAIKPNTMGRQPEPLKQDDPPAEQKSEETSPASGAGESIEGAPPIL